MAAEKATIETSAAKGKPIDLLETVTLPSDSVSGSWRKTEDGIESESGHSCLKLRYAPKGEYDFRISFTRKNGDEGVVQILHYGNAGMIWAMGVGKNDWCWYGDVHDAKSSDYKVKLPDTLKNGTPHTSVVKVRSDSLTAYLDGKLVKQLPTDYSNVSLSDGWNVGANFLGLGSESPTIIHAAEVIPVADNRDAYKPAKGTTQKSKNALAVGTIWKGVQSYTSGGSKPTTHRLDGKLIVKAAEKNTITAEYWVEDKSAKVKARGLELDLTRRKNKLTGKVTKFLGDTQMKHFHGGGIFDGLWEGKLLNDDRRVVLHFNHPDGSVANSTGHWNLRQSDSVVRRLRRHRVFHGADRPYWRAGPCQPCRRALRSM